MAISIPRSLVETILLGPTGDRRQLQDSPILADVWMAFASEPDRPQELLITPHKRQTAGFVAIELDELIHADRDKRSKRTELAHFAYLQGVIAARLYFDELLRIVVPRTAWWKSSRNRDEMHVYLGGKEAAEKRLSTVLDCVHSMATHWSAPGKTAKPGGISALDRYAAIAGIILWAGRSDTRLDQDGAPSEKEALAQAIGDGKQVIAKELTDLFLDILEQFPPLPQQEERDPLVYQVSLNREVSAAIARSVSAVKADAATSLFRVKCGDIAWAVIDSGIQGDHPAFVGADGTSRVRASFDFSNYRDIVSLDNLRIFRKDADQETRGARLGKLLHDKLKAKPSEEKAIEYLTSLATDVRYERPIHWEFVEPFIEILPATRPSASDHGTHVAGIIGASKKGPAYQEKAKLQAKKRGKAKEARAKSRTEPEARIEAEASGEDERGEYADGVCPDIQLYDFRVLAEATESIKDTEFAVIAALQYIRHLNARHDFITIHGANLSLAIQHDVHNYACGRTPVCVECEKLVESGVVVVAAAGNFGYQSYLTREGSYEGYAPASITDPGNADGVITVGATHRYSPHTYGVSFFSSRGPTGDGRLKPDLVAPGERIRSAFRDGWDDLDGTSMAAPHVSGAAAMLMARYSELIGQPRRIKEILCESATDLGRERNFQGHGMLDVLRAFQSI